VDAPLHFISGGDTVEAMSLDALIGPAVLAYLPQVAAVTAADLEALGLPANVERLLLRTPNSELWSTAGQDFQPNFVALTIDAAEWLVQRHIRLIGVDYLSVQRFGDGPQVHQILLEAGAVIVEGLNLAGVQPGVYELMCLPLKLAGAEGAPARAVLRKANRRGGS
jgi:arylformamidase